MIRPYVLTIAGFDPSGGAGILADAKTLEANKVIGLGVVSANTFQHEDLFLGVDWIPKEAIIKQLEILFNKYPIHFVKIGLVESLDVLWSMIKFMQEKNPHVQIVWDPVLKASAGFIFHAAPSRNLFEDICKNIFILTPNWHELQALYPEFEPVYSARRLAQYCTVYLKGGHSDQKKGRDYLFSKSKEFVFNPKVLAQHDKHGTGCVFSSALTAHIARGFPLKKACLKAKSYITYFLLSNKSLLGYHK